MATDDFSGNLPFFQGITFLSGYYAYCIIRDGGHIRHFDNK